MCHTKTYCGHRGLSHVVIMVLKCILLQLWNQAACWVNPTQTSAINWMVYHIQSEWVTEIREWKPEKDGPQTFKLILFLLVLCPVFVDVTTMCPSPLPRHLTCTCQRPRVALRPECSLPPLITSNITPRTSLSFSLPLSAFAGPRPSRCISPCPVFSEVPLCAITHCFHR